MRQPASRSASSGLWEILVSSQVHLAELRNRMVAAAEVELGVQVPGEPGIARAVEKVVEMTLSHFAEGRGLNDRERRQIGVIGAGTARQGIPLGALVAVVLACERVAYDFVAARVRERRLTVARLDVLYSLTLRLRDSTEEIRGALAEAHNAWTVRHGNDEDIDKVQALLLRLVLGEYGLEAEMVGRSLQLGHDLAKPYGLLLITSRDAAAVRRAASALSRRLAGTMALTRATDGTSVVFVPTDRPAAWSQVALLAAESSARDHQVKVVAAAPVAGPDRLRLAYRRLTATAPLALARFQGAAVVNVNDLAFDLIFSRAEQRLGFVDSILGPVLRLNPAERDQLLETLTAYFESSPNGRDQVAERLHVTWEAVRKRLAKVRKLTGFPDGTREGSAGLYVALRLARSGAQRGTEMYPPGYR